MQVQDLGSAGFLFFLDIEMTEARPMLFFFDG
jgi:hypothetical protein